MIKTALIMNLFFALITFCLLIYYRFEGGYQRRDPYNQFMCYSMEISFFIHLSVCVLVTREDSQQHLWAIFIAMILSTVVFIYIIFFNGKDYCKNYDRWEVNFLKDYLEKSGIDYSSFQSLGRKEQIDILKRTPDKECGDYLINSDEEEEDIEFYELILNKE